MKLSVSTVLLLVLFSSGARGQSFLEVIDVNGDGLATEGDRHAVLWWIQNGGDWPGLMDAIAHSDDSAGVIDATHFFSSGAAQISSIGIFKSSNSGLTCPGAPCLFLRGDSNCDDVVNISDSIFTLAHVFGGGAAPASLDAGDANDDGQYDLSDSVLLDELPLSRRCCSF